jgi:apolipoprotein N-acyltransferase
MSDPAEVDAGSPITASSVPDSAADKRSSRFARAAIGGVLLALSFPPYGLSLLMPIGITSLLISLERATIRQAFFCGAACGVVYFGGTLFWLFNLFGAAAITLIAIAASFVILFAVVYAWLIKRLPGAPAWLIAGITWVAIEYFRSELFTLNFGWMGLGYGTAGTILCAILAPIIGSYGISFVIILIGAALALRPKAGWQLAILTIWSIVVIVPAPLTSPSLPIRVRLVQANSGDEDSLFGLSKTSVGASPDVIVWPEYSFVSDPRREAKLWNRLQSVAKDGLCVFIFGAEDEVDPSDPAGFRNTAFVLGPDGNLLGTHIKNHPVHFYREGIRGTEARAIPSLIGRIGVAICFDMDYPDVARRLAQHGAEVFLVPNDDPPEWGSVQRGQHRLMFAMRAAECRRWLARADVAGGTSVVSPTGREVAHVTTNEPTALSAVIGRETGRTLYVRGGWRFGQVCMICLGGLMIAALLARPDSEKRL